MSQNVYESVAMARLLRPARQVYDFYVRTCYTRAFAYMLRLHFVILHVPLWALVVATQPEGGTSTREPIAFRER